MLCWAACRGKPTANAFYLICPLCRDIGEVESMSVSVCSCIISLFYGIFFQASKYGRYLVGRREPQINAL